MRKFLFVIAMQIAHYLIWVFGYLDFNFFSETYRIFYVITAGVFGLFTWGMIEGWGDGTPKWLETPTHEEKKSSIKKYIGELHEELNLYSEAKDLERRVNELRKSKS